MNNKSPSRNADWLLVFFLLIGALYLLPTLARLTPSDIARIICNFTDCPNPDMPRNIFRENRDANPQTRHPKVGRSETRITTPIPVLVPSPLPMPQLLDPTPMPSLAPPTGLPHIGNNHSKRTRVTCSEVPNMFGDGYSTECTLSQ